MADTKISALTSGAPAQATDATVIARAGANYKLTVSDIVGYLGFADLGRQWRHGRHDLDGQRQCGAVYQPNADDPAVGYADLGQLVQLYG